MFGDRANEIALFEIESFKRNFSIPSLAKTLETFAHCDLSADVAKLSMPVMVLMGNSGHLGAATSHQAAAIEAFTAQCPHAKVVLIDNGGGTYHMIEQPEQTTQRPLYCCTNRHGTIRVYGYPNGNIRVRTQQQTNQSCVFDGT